jgi:hypothetical protein
LAAPEQRGRDQQEQQPERRCTGPGGCAARKRIEISDIEAPGPEGQRMRAHEHERGDAHVTMELHQRIRAEGLRSYAQP